MNDRIERAAAVIVGRPILPRQAAYPLFKRFKAVTSPRRSIWISCEEEKFKAVCIDPLAPGCVAGTGVAIERVILGWHWRIVDFRPATSV